MWENGDTVELILFLFHISFLPNYIDNDYDYTVKWCSGVAGNWCVGLSIGLTLALTGMLLQSLLGTEKRVSTFQPPNTSINFRTQFRVTDISAQITIVSCI